MNGKRNKIAAGLLLFAMLLFLLPGRIPVSYGASGKITFSDPSVTAGDQFSVTMKITSDDAEGLGASEVMLQYDASKLEFLSGTGANGGAGSIRVVGSMETSGQKTFSFTLKFKALKAGDTSVTVTRQEVYDSSSQTVSVSHVGSSAVKVKSQEAQSDNAALSSLTISPGTLNPAFSPDTTSYTAVVAADVEDIAVDAPAADSSASVSVSGNKGLQMGENTIECKVTAENGTTTRSYVITVTKTDDASAATEGGEPSVPANAGAQDSGMSVVVDDVTWQIAEAFEVAAVPEGFTASEYMYQGTSIQACTDENGRVLFYMTDPDGNGDFFLYDEENELFAPYVTILMAEKTVIVLPPEALPEDTVLPEGFVECTITIGTHTVDGWIWDTNGETSPEYCVVYAMNQNGERGFYRYDQKEMTLQRYFEDPNAEELKAQYAGIAEEFNSLLNDYKLRGWIMAGLFGLSILLLIIVIVLLLIRKPKDPYDSDGDYHYEEEPEDTMNEEDFEPIQEQSRRISTGRNARDELDYQAVASSRQADPDARIRAGRQAPARRYPVEEYPNGPRTSAHSGYPADGSAPMGRQPEREPVNVMGRQNAAGQPRSLQMPEEGQGSRVRRNVAAEQEASIRRQAPAKSVADMEKDIAASLAREAAQTERSDINPEEDDDFEFIDLDM